MRRPCHVKRSLAKQKGGLGFLQFPPVYFQSEFPPIDRQSFTNELSSHNSGNLPQLMVMALEF